MEAPILGRCEMMCPPDEIKLYVFSFDKHFDLIKNK